MYRGFECICAAPRLVQFSSPTEPKSMEETWKVSDSQKQTVRPKPLFYKTQLSFELFIHARKASIRVASETFGKFRFFCRMVFPFPPHFSDVFPCKFRIDRREWRRNTFYSNKSKNTEMRERYVICTVRKSNQYFMLMWEVEHEVTGKYGWHYLIGVTYCFDSVLLTKNLVDQPSPFGWSNRNKVTPSSPKMTMTPWPGWLHH